MVPLFLTFYHANSQIITVSLVYIELTGLQSKYMSYLLLCLLPHKSLSLSGTGLSIPRAQTKQGEEAFNFNAPRI